MNSTGHETTSSTALSEDTVSTTITVEEEETENWNNPDRTMECRASRLGQGLFLPLQLDLTRRRDSTSHSTESGPRKTGKARSLSSCSEEPRNFLTGVEYRTKFMREKRNDKNWAEQSRNVRRPQSSYGGSNRHVVSGSYAAKYAAQRRSAGTRSVTSRDEEPRNFLTGLEYRTKFMRQLPNTYDVAQKFRFNSGDVETRVNARGENKWRQGKSRASLLKYPIRKALVQKSTEVISYLRQAFPVRRPSPYSESTSETGTTRAKKGNSADKVKAYRTVNTPSSGQKSPETIKVDERRTHQRLTKSSEAMPAESGPSQNEKLKANTKTNEASRVSPAFGQTGHSFVRNISDNFVQAINRADLSINLPNSPISEPAGSNSLHTTPRSPRIDKKPHSNSFFLHVTPSETRSLQSEDHSPSLSELLKMQRPSSPQVKAGCSQKPRSPIKKYRFFPSSDNTLAYKSRESLVNALGNKKTTTATKQEPVIFTTQFVPLLRWTSKTSSGGLFEPRSQEGSHSRPNSRTGFDDQNGACASNDNTSEGNLSNRKSKEAPTSSTTGDAIQNQPCIKQQETAADKVHISPRPPLIHTLDKGDNHTSPRRTNKKSTTQNKALSKEADRNHTAGHHTTPAKPIWRLTGPQKIVSGCALWSTTPSPLLRQTQSVKNKTMMAKQPSARTKTTNTWAVGDFARRPIAAVVVNKKPVWK